MSALARTSTNQQKTAHQGVTSISVNARVDYILRFSKQAVLIVDETGEESASVGHQFLGQLADSHNVAFLSASHQLNNIQQRCRIIEQLFPNQVFDPEQSLAVSIVNLVNETPQKVAIVLGNAQFSTLQIIHELAQLAVIAKKANLSIDIVMFGDYQAGNIVKSARELFTGKLSILSAESAQLLPLTSPLFSAKSKQLLSLLNNKWLYAFLLLVSASIGTVYWLYQKDSFVFTKLPKSVVEPAKQPIETSLLSKISPEKVETIISSELLLASNEEIYLAVIGQLTKKERGLTANSLDVLSALSVSEKYDSSTKLTSYEGETPPTATLQQKEIQPVSINKAMEPTTNQIAPKSTTTLDKQKFANVKASDSDTGKVIVSPLNKPSDVKSQEQIEKSYQTLNDGSYFQQFNDGFVIQISGFTQKMIMKQFLEQHSEQSFKQYQRVLNNEIMFVLTSQRYATRTEAETALAQLPNTISSRNPWIKSITAINSEINAFERSQ